LLKLQVKISKCLIGDDNMASAYTKEIELIDRDIKTKIILRKMTMGDRETLQNEAIELISKKDNNSEYSESQKIKTGTLKKYTLILGISEAPFFKTVAIGNMKVTDRIINQRLIEYEQLPIEYYNLVDPIIQQINKYNDTTKLEGDIEEIQSKSDTSTA